MQYTIFYDDKPKVELLNEAIKRMDINDIYNILNDISRGDIVNDTDKQLKTPIYYAGICSNQKFGLEVTNLLLERGANPFHKDQNKQTVLYYLAKYGRCRIMDKLMEFNFHLNQNDNMGQTPLFFAAVDGRLQAAEILVKNGADVNHKDFNNQTCLFYAAREGHLEMCRFLYNQGINLLHHDHNKKTAVFYAKNRNQRHIVDFLNSFKNQNKKAKEQKKIFHQLKIQDSSQNQQKSMKKKRQSLRVDYVLVYTNEKGQVHELTQEEIKKFRSSSDFNQKLYDLMRNPDKLDSQPMPTDRKYQKIANKIITHFWKLQNSAIFHQPVDWQTLGLKDYPEIVKNPMDFGTIKTKIAYNAYNDGDQFRDDMLLVFDNCILYNGKDSIYGKIATQMKLQFANMYNKESLNIDKMNYGNYL